MKLNRFWAVFAAILLVSASAFAQTTSNLTGRVTMDGNPLPGVTVTISSPNLQGTRTAVTDVNGNYNFAAIPPGDYTVKFEMESMQTATRTARLGLGQTGRADAEMRLTAVAEAITVTASAPAVLETTEIQTNVTAQLVDDLPVPRTFQSQANLAPNVTTNGPNAGQLVISGAPAHENLYMVNGAVINENLRSQIHNLFIEDAIQETTVLTGAISAEYGRFTGGVVNSITKSGGNEFSGSFRDSLTNPSWTDKTPFPGQADPTDVLNEVYEATFGGRIIRDRLWFFTAGRYIEESRDQFLFGTSNQYTMTIEDTRLEGKLTGQITPKHSVAVSYLDIDHPEGPYCFIACYEFSNIDPSRTLPNSFLTAHYAGIFTSNLLGEINYSEKKFAFEGSGGPATDDPALGSWGYDLNTGAFFGAPVFCEDCGAEERNNDYLDAKLTYYLASKALGTHNITGGYQDWAEQRIANNYQSGSNFSVYTYSEQHPAEDGNFKPVLEGGESFATFINWTPIFTLTDGSNFATKSFYINDKWDLSNNWQFNLGVRYDKNDGTDAGGGKTADDSLFSPRLGAIWDVMGNGRLRFNASYGQYVAKIAETIGGGGSGAGNPAYVWYAYMGPDISGLPTTEAFRLLFDWFEEQGGTEATDLIVFAQFPGVSTRIADEGLKSPNVQEWTVGVGTQLGRGYARLDLISRDWADFYGSRTIPNVQVADPLGQESDLVEYFTTNDGLERTYRGFSLQANYPFTERFQLGGNYTWSETKGNVTAETAGSGPVTESVFRYPEFKAFEQNNPVGFLPSDQTHKLRAWATYTLPTPIGNFTFSALERFDSGTPFSALGTVDTRPYVSSAIRAQYLGDPTGVNYYFGERGGFRWDDANALDISINYRLRLGRVELFVQPELINAFNEDAVVLGDTTVLTAKNTSSLQAFNPYTETPVEGTHYRFGSNFGKPRTALDYQQPRTYRVSAGIRF
jgi:outer membrane receptor protein involved in Fe transport